MGQVEDTLSHRVMVPVLQILLRDYEHGVPLPSVSLSGNAVTNLTGHEHIAIHGSISSELGVLKDTQNGDGKCI